MLKNVFSWFKTPPTGSEWILIPVAVFGVDFVLSSLISSFLPGIDSTTPLIGPIFVWYFPLLLIGVALLEEIVFRILPLTLALKRWGVGWRTSVVLLLTSFLLFGLAHGHFYNLLLQGVGGLLYGLTFIKFSESGKHWVRAAFVVILMHLIFDTAIVIELIGYGETVF